MDSASLPELHKHSKVLSLSFCFVLFCSFLSGFSFTDTDDSQDSRWREGTIFYSTLPLPPADEHSDIYLQLCMWDDCLYLPDLNSMRLTTLSNYHLIDWWCDVNFCLFTWWYSSRFCWSNLTRETVGLELASTITLALQANQLIKCVFYLIIFWWTLSDSLAGEGSGLPLLSL